MSPEKRVATEEQARDFVTALGDEVAIERLEHFVRLLRTENEHQNLVSVRSLEVVWQRHIADSAQLLAHVPRETYFEDGMWLDLGSGPGLPGLVLSILRPENRVVLIESRSKRVGFLETCVRELSLPRCEVIGRRFEKVRPMKASLITARAFAPLPKLLDLCDAFSTARTLYLLPKGRSAAHELSTLSFDDRQLFHVEQSLTNNDAGIIVGRVRPKGGGR